MRGKAPPGFRPLLVPTDGSERPLRVEWYIVALIVVEIPLALYGMWLR